MTGRSMISHPIKPFARPRCSFIKIVEMGEKHFNMKHHSLHPRRLPETRARRTKVICDRLSQIFPTKAVAKGDAADAGDEDSALDPMSDPIDKAVSRQRVNGHQPSIHIDCCEIPPALPLSIVSDLT